ncbi:FtsX-like permease family protein, partial [Angustibacter peucedani]
RAADRDGRYAMAVAALPGSNETTPGLAVDGTRAAAVLGFAGRGPDDVQGVIRPTLPPSFVLRPGVVEVRASTADLRSPSPLELSATLETDAGWREADLGALREGPQTYRGTVPSSCSAGCRLVALTVRHPATDIVSGTATVTFNELLAGPAGRPERLDAGFDRRGTWRPPVVDTGGASAPLEVGAGGLVARVTTPVGFPARVFRGDAPSPAPALGGPETPSRDGLVRVRGFDGVPTGVRQAGRAAFVPGLGRGGALVDLELVLRSVQGAQSDEQQVWLSRDDAGAERALRGALASSGITVTGRSTAAQALDVLDGEGAVLALLLFLACGAVAVLVAVGAVLVAAFVGSRARAAEVSALRSVGVRRRVLRRALLLENVAGVLVALVCAMVAALVAVVVVLPVLPLADEDSSVLVPRTTPDLLAGAWSAAGVTALLVVLAVLVATAQLRASSVERMREGAR